ncbi:hypothetical protein LO771_07155 [Streptacidiphilus sp. ASG 303]|uniref:anti-sigma factor n=1 Tax=Streptacidiphilus sp. ASG 303 TaxID=2896847 RepID=UPI001E3B9C6B|nr:anti-sigma factor [Streptacidiphilus sp. ASG 303]MCD0482196.1 hypothetical protein [Streptacidiphilus sp. ASG 303]
MTPIDPGDGPTGPPPRSAADIPEPVSHPAVEEIADLTEDLLPPQDADAVRAHLDGCAECADTRDALLEIRSLLGDSGTPRMPADVAGRIDAALAAEALLASAPLGDGDAWAAALAAAPGAPDGPAGRDGAERPPDAAAQDGETRPAPARGTPAAAGAARPAGTGDGGTAAGGGRTRPPGRSGRGSGTAAPGAPGPGRRARRRPARVLLAAAALAVVAGFGGLLLNGFTNDGGGSTADSAASAVRAQGKAGGPARSAPGGAHALQAPQPRGAAPRAGGTGTEYTEQDLGPQIMQLVGDRIPAPSVSPLPSAPAGASSGSRPRGADGTVRPGSPTGPGAAAGAGPAPGSRGEDAPSLPVCVLQATGRADDRPVATDLGTFRGDPVAVVVYPADGDGDLEVFLVDATCDLRAPAAPGTVRLHRTVTGR